MIKAQTFKRGSKQTFKRGSKRPRLDAISFVRDMFTHHLLRRSVIQYNILCEYVDMTFHVYDMTFHVHHMFESHRSKGDDLDIKIT